MRTINMIMVFLVLAVVAVAPVFSIADENTTNSGLTSTITVDEESSEQARVAAQNNGDESSVDSYVPYEEGSGEPKEATQK